MSWRMTPVLSKIRPHSVQGQFQAVPCFALSIPSFFVLGSQLVPGRVCSSPDRHCNTPDFLAGQNRLLVVSLHAASRCEPSLTNHRIRGGGKFFKSEVALHFTSLRGCAPQSSVSGHVYPVPHEPHLPRALGRDDGRSRPRKRAPFRTMSIPTIRYLNPRRILHAKAEYPRTLPLIFDLLPLPTCIAHLHQVEWRFRVRPCTSPRVEVCKSRFPGRSVPPDWCDGIGRTSRKRRSPLLVDTRPQQVHHRRPSQMSQKARK
jgi:hypothetical protein